MKLIEPSFEIWEQNTDIRLASVKHVADHILINGIYKQIERAGRVCYKSEDKITKDSCISFVNRLIDAKHYAMLEHGTVYLQIDINSPVDFVSLVMFYNNNKYSYVNHSEDNTIYYITTNYRVIIESGHQDDLKYLCSPTEFHERRVTVHFICNRQVSHEFVRHRPFSFAMESTRYCNYSKGKFNSELTFINPLWCNYATHSLIDNPETIIEQNLIQVEDAGSIVFKEYCEQCEQTYLNLINEGWQPQQAATILPNAIKTELVMTGFISDWKHFFDLRAIGTTGAPHPQAKQLAEPLMNKFKELNLC